MLSGALRYEPRPSVALNLAVSLVTVVAALTVRSSTLDLEPAVDLLPVAAAMSPTPLFVFGADVVVAGTVSLAISLSTVAVGATRHARRGSYVDPADRRSTILPMGIGSVVGAVVGGGLAGLAPRSAIELCWASS